MTTMPFGAMCCGAAIRHGNKTDDAHNADQIWLTSTSSWRCSSSPSPDRDDHQPCLSSRALDCSSRTQNAFTTLSTRSERSARLLFRAGLLVAVLVALVRPCHAIDITTDSLLSALHIPSGAIPLAPLVVPPDPGSSNVDLVVGYQSGTTLYTSRVHGDWDNSGVSVVWQTQQDVLLANAGPTNWVLTDAGAIVLMQQQEQQSASDSTNNKSLVVMATTLAALDGKSSWSTMWPASIALEPGSLLEVVIDGSALHAVGQRPGQNGPLCVTTTTNVLHPLSSASLACGNLPLRVPETTFLYRPSPNPLRVLQQRNGAELLDGPVTSIPAIPGVAAPLPISSQYAPPTDLRIADQWLFATPPQAVFLVGNGAIHGVRGLPPNATTLAAASTGTTGPLTTVRLDETRSAGAIVPLGLVGEDTLVMCDGSSVRVGAGAATSIACTVDDRVYAIGKDHVALLSPKQGQIRVYPRNWSKLAWAASVPTAGAGSGTGVARLVMVNSSAALLVSPSKVTAAWPPLAAAKGTIPIDPTDPKGVVPTSSSLSVVTIAIATVGGALALIATFCVVRCWRRRRRTAFISLPTSTPTGAQPLISQAPVEPKKHRFDSAPSTPSTVGDGLHRVLPQSASATLDAEALLLPPESRPPHPVPTAPDVARRMPLPSRVSSSSHSSSRGGNGAGTHAPVALVPTPPRTVQKRRSAPSIPHTVTAMASFVSLRGLIHGSNAAAGSVSTSSIPPSALDAPDASASVESNSDTSAGKPMSATRRWKLILKNASTVALVDPDDEALGPRLLHRASAPARQAVVGRDAAEASVVRMSLPVSLLRRKSSNLSNSSGKSALDGLLSPQGLAKEGVAFAPSPAPAANSPPPPAPRLPADHALGVQRTPSSRSRAPPPGSLAAAAAGRMETSSLGSALSFPTDMAPEHEEDSESNCPRINLTPPDRAATDETDASTTSVGHALANWRLPVPPRARRNTFGTLFHSQELPSWGGQTNSDMSGIVMASSLGSPTATSFSGGGSSSAVPGSGRPTPYGGRIPGMLSTALLSTVSLPPTANSSLTTLHHAGRVAAARMQVLDLPVVDDPNYGPVAVPRRAVGPRRGARRHPSPGNSAAAALFASMSSLDSSSRATLAVPAPTANARRRASGDASASAGLLPTPPTNAVARSDAPTFVVESTPIRGTGGALPLPPLTPLSGRSRASSTSASAATLFHMHTPQVTAGRRMTVAAAAGHVARSL
ncbi:hypothetical protein AMAG_12936 [Allomyces macrogynus ATCC 38327]|uniref:Uncharacterized protein n=1 Tax=Allomyces macrogynus (strain ATCC 38327) TaxID=578462 RepID=A0A0L0T0T6_ALLM3|nr:hypothetical protein AMAG_12936 [Allomyces macrogynus ATCC 38327]|eukprot:KNE68265.1 hypothetical protein AMAG_12936 [Allomyces macrogynus ATCC 38327]